jgi:hypothetical protein
VGEKDDNGPWSVEGAGDQRKETHQHWPAIQGGRPGRRFCFGDYSAIVLTDVEFQGTIEYLYVMPVFKMPENRFCLCVTSETNRLYGQGEQRSHFLGLFDGQRHRNYGASDDWSDIEKFTVRALELARDYLKVPDVAVEVRFSHEPDFLQFGSFS